MSLTNEKKVDIMSRFGRGEKDSGSPEVQVALLTERISILGEHFKHHKNDFNSRRGLLSLVGRRRRLLNYHKSKDIKKYEEILGKLSLRK